jgi:hypothetical protein
MCIEILQDKIDTLLSGLFPPDTFPPDKFGPNFFTWQVTPSEGFFAARDERCFAIEITLSGNAIRSAVTVFQANLGENGRVPRANLAGALWRDNAWSFVWLLPESLVSRTENPHFTDVHDQRWFSPLLALPKEGKSDRENPANLDSWRVLPAFWLKAEWHWRQFREKLRQGNLLYKSLVALEAALNAPWTSSKANERMLRDFSDYGDVNHLRLMETKRQVNIVHGKQDAESGRIRLPHLSHRNRLCPYQTPESKDIGLHLFRSAGSEWVPEGERIQEGESLFSLATGLIPYLQHSDGPRLLMGGKNLKQAEHGIAALKSNNPEDKCAPTAMIPGRLESEIETDEVLGIENHRYKYPLGIDAFVAIMPYEGYTYEDGLVVSSDFAEKMRIPEGTYVQSEVLKLNVPKDKDKNLPSIQRMQKDFEDALKILRGTNYSYDEELPLPLEMEILRSLDGEGILVPRYHYRYPGKLTDCSVTVVSGRRRAGSYNRAGDAGGTLLQLRMRYTFTIDRPLAVGDKLTGRHGNKGVVAHILEAPASAVVGGVEVPIDLMISPGALMGRKNTGQLYEMTHSLLLWGKEKKLFKGKKEEGIEKLKNVTRDRLLTHDEMAGLLPVVKEMAGDEKATFEIRLPGEKKGSCRAFVGFQHIARLHHHVRAKLQYRGDRGPFNANLGQPGSGGGTAGQRLGEMENWSCLSHPIFIDKEQTHDSFDLLFEMRKRHGAAGKTRELARSILWALGYEVTDDAKISRLDEAGAIKPFPKKGGVSPIRKDLWSIKYNDISRWRAREASSVSRLEIEPERRLTYDYKSRPLKDLLEKAIKKSKASEKQQDRIWSFFVRDDKKVFLPVALDVLYQQKDVEKAFQKMISAFAGFFMNPTKNNALALIGRSSEKKRKKKNSRHEDNAMDAMDAMEESPMLIEEADANSIEEEQSDDGDKSLKGAVSAYRKALIELLDGKMGLLRRHLLGRRLNHSGRAVIVPCPDLEIDCVRLPLPLFLGILTDETRKRLQPGRALKKAFPQNTDEVNRMLEEKPVWMILIRQPSLHRHNFMAFRASCWDRDVIGIPPFVTPGYNADFDGDTMAVFLPPEPCASDLSHMTFLRNPGLVGTGQLALASGLDLALGWMHIFLKNKKARKEWLKEAGCDTSGNGFTSLNDVLAGLFRKLREDESTLKQKILELQQAVCSASTGSATMTPVEFEELSQAMETYKLRNPSFDEKAAEDELKTWVENAKNDDNNLARFVRYKVKGGEKELRVMTAFIGEQDDYRKSKGKESEESRIEDSFWKARIEGSFWKGLNDDEMFRYSYASRSAMASKKLDVAKAGYFSYLLTMGLYETKIAEDRCSCSAGMKVFWEGDALYLSVPSMEGSDSESIRFPLPGEANRKNLTTALGRIAWGRETVKVSKPRLLTTEDIAKIAAFWCDKNEKGKRKGEPPAGILDKDDALWLRSPLTCAAKGHDVCAACAGADPASRPYDRPVPMPFGSRVGLTAAQAIGERGTQLAMKRFHDTAEAGKSSIEVLRSLLVRGRDDEGKVINSSNSSFKRFRLLIEEVLTETGKHEKNTAFKELPQQLIHFELALRAPEGLEAWSPEMEGRWLSALACGAWEMLEKAGCEQWGVQSRLMWDREAKGGKP